MEPAHREAYVNLGQARSEGVDPARFSLAEQALRGCAEKNRIEVEQLSLRPEDLGVRITYLANGPPAETPTERRGPDCDFAVPFARRGRDVGCSGQAAVWARQRPRRDTSLPKSATGVALNGSTHTSDPALGAPELPAW